MSPLPIERDRTRKKKKAGEGKKKNSLTDSDILIMNRSTCIRTDCDARLTRLSHSAMTTSFTSHTKLGALGVPNAMVYFSSLRKWVRLCLWHSTQLFYSPILHKMHYRTYCGFFPPFLFWNDCHCSTLTATEVRFLTTLWFGKHFYGKKIGNKQPNFLDFFALFFLLT